MLCIGMLLEASPMCFSLPQKLCFAVWTWIQMPVASYSRILFHTGEVRPPGFCQPNCAHMCGITFSRCASELPSELFEALCTTCHSRGPDYQGRRIVEHVPSNTFLHFYASTLHLRGDHVARQPFVKSQNVLIYVRYPLYCDEPSI